MPAAEAIVGGALADYDTLSASQVVRRLESLGPEELRAVQRYEASTRNRRTILNRAGQLLDEQLARAARPTSGDGAGPAGRSRGPTGLHAPALPGPAWPQRPCAVAPPWWATPRR